MNEVQHTKYKPFDTLKIKPELLRYSNHFKLIVYFKGDSGGPLVCEGQVYGVVSASAELDGFQIYCFTKVPVYKTWIDEIIGRHGNYSKMSNHSI